MSATGINMRIKNAFNRPSPTQAAANCSRRQSEFSSPLHDCLSASIQLKDVIRSLVVVLLRGCSPSAVIGRIRAVIVNSIYGHSFWSFSHVINKVRYAFAPAFADNNSTSAIIGKTAAMAAL